MGTKSVFKWAASAIAIVAAQPALAQGQPAADSRTPALELEDIVVTANRREENAQSAPVSVVAIGPQALQEQGVRSLGDLTRVAPGIRFVHQGGGGNMNVVMRGLQRIPIGNAPNAVINYFADVPLPFAGSNIPTYDLGSVQVLRGPQGTLFGRNAIGGAVIITPQAPTDVFEGYVRASYGNYDYKDLEGALNVPIVDGKIALRVAGKISRRDGYTKNLSGNTDSDDMHQDSFRATLRIEPSDNFRNITVFDWFRAREAGTGAILVAALPTGLTRLPQLAHFYDCNTINPFNPTGCAGIPGVLPPGRDIDDQLALQRKVGVRRTFSDLDNRVDRDLWGISNRTEFDIADGVTLRNIFGYRKTKVLTDISTDGVDFLPLPIINASSRVREQQISDEVHLFGNLFDNRLDYLVGAFYIKEKPAGLAGSNFTVATPSAPWIISYNRKTNKAVFGQVGFKVVEGVKVNAGIRYNKTKQSACSVTPPILIPTTAIEQSEPSVGPGDCASAPKSSIVRGSESATTYNIGVDWQVTDEVFAYITHRKGYREGGINTPFFNTPCTTGGSNGVCVGAGGVVIANPADLRPYQTYKPETLKDIEAGLKTEFRLGEGRIRFNISAFRATYSNAVIGFNTSGIVPNTDPASPTQTAVGINVGKRRLTGFETEVMFQPTPSLSFVNTIAHVKQKILSTTLPNIPGLQLPSLTPASPTWSTTTTARWVLPFRPADGELVLNVDYYAQGRFYNGNDSFPGYDVANSRIEWNNIGGTGLDAAAFVRNIFNNDYAYASATSAASLGFLSRAYGEPRLYGVELGFHF